MKTFLYILALIAICFGIFMMVRLFKTSSQISPKPVYSGDSYIDSLIYIKAQKYDIDPDLFAALIKIESEFNPLTTGKAGEIGLGQLHPKYILALLYDPEINLELSARELATWRIKFGKDALAAYNAGYKLERGRGYQIKVEKQSRQFKKNQEG